MVPAKYHHFLPRRFLTKFVYFLTRRRSAWFKTFSLNTFCKIYPVNLEECERKCGNDQWGQFETFNDFFTRTLKPGARPIDTSPSSITSPVDGKICALGPLNDTSIIQAKGLDYSLNDLVAEQTHLIKAFSNSQMMTIYLAPQDYHRVHMPCDATLEELIYVPGDLFSVNDASVRIIPSLFARNERLLCRFSTPWGDLLFILVGAMLVGGLETVWTGSIKPKKPRQLEHWTFAQKPYIKKGEEMGRFNMGSTVIMLFNSPTLAWDKNMTIQSNVKLGEKIGEALPNDLKSSKNTLDSR